MAQENNNTQLTLKDLQEMDWRRYEFVCLEYFKEKGYKAEFTNGGADGGIDIILKKLVEGRDDLTIYVQCKAWSSRVGVKEVREFFGVMASDSVKLGVFMSASEFTADAEQFVKNKKLKLISGKKLLELISKLSEASQKKITDIAFTGDYLTPTCPSCETKMVLRTSSKAKNYGEKFWGCTNFPKCRQRFHVKKSWKEKNSNTKKEKIQATPGFWSEHTKNLGIRAEKQHRYETKAEKQLSKKKWLLPLVGIGALLFFLAVVPMLASKVISGFGESLMSKSEQLREQQLKEQELRRKEQERLAAQKQKVREEIKAIEAKAREERRKAKLLQERKAKQKAENWRVKNEAWLAWYEEPRGCNNWRSDEHMIDCTNHKMKAREAFEGLWTDGKISPKNGSSSKQK